MLGDHLKSIQHKMDSKLGHQNRVCYSSIMFLARRMIFSTLLTCSCGVLLQACATQNKYVAWNEVSTQTYDHIKNERRFRKEQQINIVAHKNSDQAVTLIEQNQKKSTIQTSTDMLEQKVSKKDEQFGGDQHQNIEDIGIHIDRALMHFQSERVRLRHLKDSAENKQAELKNWQIMLQKVSRACAGEPEANDFGAFVRARAVIDVEQHQDLSRHIQFPESIEQDIEILFTQMDSRVAELRLASPEIPIHRSAGIKMDDLILTAPLDRMVITSPFGMRSDPIHHKKRFHTGVDIGAPLGTSVVASEEGIVIYAGWQGGYGRHVVIEHGNGIRTHYSHLSAIFVKSRQHVTKGESIASVGASGRSTGPHLHWAVTNSKGQFVDPLKALHEQKLVTYKKRHIKKKKHKKKKPQIAMR